MPQVRQATPPSVEPPSPLDILPAASPPAAPPRTLEELAHSVDIIMAANVIEFDVHTFHQEWDGITPIHRETLCAAGKAIRSAMRTYQNTVADLTRAERAIYDITAPSGRCR
jgi:hypothetical protein